MKAFSAIVLLLSGLLLAQAAPKRVVCYWGSWSIYRKGDGTFNVQNIDTSLCTHYIHTFVGISQDGTVHSLDTWNDIDLAGFKRFNDMKKANGNIKTLMAVGGWNEGSIKYSDVAAQPTLRQNMIQSALKLVLEFGFDGFDLDWEYPADRGGHPEDVQNFVSLVKEFRQEFDKHGLLLTAAVGASASRIQTSYNVPELSKYLDWFNVMTYDLHGPWEHNVGINAPLYASSKDTNAEAKQLNVDACIKAWLAAGAPKEKISMGLGAYGKSFTLTNAANHNLYDAAVGKGPAGPYTGEMGTLGYNEICLYIKNENWNVVWENEQKVPYMFKDNVWVGFDNERSIKEKVQYAMDLGLGGMMVWSIDTDDFLGRCGKAYPLLTAVNEALGHHVSPTPAPTTTTTKGTPEGSTSKAPSTGFTCKASGYFANPNQCNLYYYCQKLVAGTFRKIEMSCPNGLFYAATYHACVFPVQSDCYWNSGDIQVNLV